MRSITGNAITEIAKPFFLIDSILKTLKFYINSHSHTIQSEPKAKIKSRLKFVFWRSVFNF